MAVPLSNFTIVEVAKPNIGERQPSRVRADITVHLTMRDNIRSVQESAENAGHYVTVPRRQA
jgi:intron-binding protein aquarius